MKAPDLNVLRNPTRLFVVRDQLLLYLRHLNEPAVHSLVNKRRLRSPTEGVVMLGLVILDEAVDLLEILSDL